MSIPAVRVTDLTKAFDAEPVVDSLSLEVPTGTVFGFLGPNGAGKTTTIRLLLGILRASSGRAEVLGHDVERDADAIRRQTGVVLDRSALYPSLTAMENLEFFADIWGMDRAAARPRQLELLDRFGLSDRRADRVGGFSRGMRQKVAAARALLHRPRLLFLDEPTAGMDPVVADEFRRQLQDLAREERTTVFLTTHDMSEAEEICDLVAVIRAGRLVALGAPHSIGRGDGAVVRITGEAFSQELVTSLSARDDVLSVDVRGPEMTVRLRERGDTPDLVAAVVHAGGRVRRVEERQGSLRAAFLELMEDSA